MDIIPFDRIEAFYHQYLEIRRPTSCRTGQAGRDALNDDFCIRNLPGRQRRRALRRGLVREGQLPLRSCARSSRSQRSSAKGITDSSLTYHLTTAKQNGVTKTEMAEILTHLAFYAGWPNAWCAFRQAKEVYADEGRGRKRRSLRPRRAEHGLRAVLHRRGFFNPLTDPTGPFSSPTSPSPPPARNNWHIHHAKSGGGQLLLCMDGLGWYQEAGKSAQAPASRRRGASRRGQALARRAEGLLVQPHIAIECPGEGDEQRVAGARHGRGIRSARRDCAQNP